MPTPFRACTAASAPSTFSTFGYNAGRPIYLGEDDDFWFGDSKPPLPAPSAPAQLGSPIEAGRKPENRARKPPAKSGFPREGMAFAGFKSECRASVVSSFWFTISWLQIARPFRAALGLAFFGNFVELV